MREYGQIQCMFWTDPDIQSLSVDARCLAAYLLTGPHSNGLGCYRLPDGYVMADFGWSSETLSKRFGELLDIRFAYRCLETHFVLIPKFLRWNPVANGNVASARVKEFDTISEKFKYFGSLIESLQQFGNHWSEPFRNRLETLSKRYAKQEPIQPDPIQPDPNRTESVRGKDGEKPTPGLIAKELRAANVSITSQNPILLAWIADGFTLDEITESVDICKTKLGDKKPIAAKYLDAVIRSERTQQPTSRDKPNGANGKNNGPPWWSSEKGIEAKGREIGMWPARTGESWQAYKGRIEMKLQEVKS